MKKVEKVIKEGDKIPWYYGIGYIDSNMQQMICYPIPANILVAIGYRLLSLLQNPRALYVTGFEKGYNNGIKNAREYIRESVDSRVNTIKEGLFDEAVEEVKDLIERGYWHPKLGNKSKLLNNQK